MTPSDDGLATKPPNGSRPSAMAAFTSVTSCSSLPVRTLYSRIFSMGLLHTVSDSVASVCGDCPTGKGLSGQRNQHCRNLFVRHVRGDVDWQRFSRRADG